MGQAFLCHLLEGTLYDNHAFLRIAEGMMAVLEKPPTRKPGQQSVYLMPVVDVRRKQGRGGEFAEEAFLNRRKVFRLLFIAYVGQVQQAGQLQLQPRTVLEEVLDLEIDPQEQQQEATYRRAAPGKGGAAGAGVAAQRDGCDQCRHTGYKGRMGIFEMMLVEEEIQDLVVRRSPLSEIKSAALAGGMKTLKMDGFEKVIQGLTTVEEIMRVVFTAGA